MKLCMYQGKMYNILFTKESLSLLHNIAYSTPMKIKKAQKLKMSITKWTQ